MFIEIILLGKSKEETGE